MTPRQPGSRCMSFWKYIAALRALKAPMGVWFSCLSHTSVPNAAATCGHTYCGVGGTSVAMKRAADSMAARSGSAGARLGVSCMLAFMRCRNIRTRMQYSYSTVIRSEPPDWPAHIYGAGNQTRSPPARAARRAPRAAHRNSRAAPRNAAALHPQLRPGIARQPLDGGRSLRPPDRRRPDRVAPRLGLLRATARQQTARSGARPRIPCPAPCST